MTDDIYSPTIGTVAVDEQDRPWRPTSQYWVAILCGPLVVTILAFLNCRRLGVPRSTQRFILMGGVVLTVLTAAFIIWSMYVFGLPRTDVRARLLPRWTLQFVSLLWAAVLVRQQTPASRLYEATSDAGYASMWRAGFFWSLISILVYGIPIIAAAWRFGFFDRARL